MENICSRNLCTGCGLCNDLCPQKAITMVEDTETGHFVPCINNELCVDCKICEKHCPSLKSPEYKSELVTYAAWRKDSGKREGSSSGGVAAEFYEIALAEGYCVVGTYLDDKCSAKLKLTDSARDIEKFRGSKYIQADGSGVYVDCIERMKAGNKVLFIGTPCQCAAMRAAAGKLYLDQVLTVELICHGVSSQKIFADYVKSIEAKKKKKITKVSFRSPWGVELSLYAGEKKVWQYKGHEDDFLVSFQEGILHNDICYSCPYAREERASDITIGDFWKIGGEIPFDKPDCKVSVLIVNSKKGMDFLKLCKGLQLVERDYQEAVNGNPNLRQPSKSHPQKERFWITYHEKGIEADYRATIGPGLRKKRIKNRMKSVAKGCLKYFIKGKGIKGC